MSEYWKSTPTYWCKFCSTYVKDTPIERKGHEASFKHQNNIQRNLRDLHKNKEREARDQQRAKDEVARLNGLVEGKFTGGSKPSGIIGLQDMGKASASGGPRVNSAAQRRLHAEQLLALGVALPEELKREVQGISSWEVVSERVIEPEEDEERSLSNIIKQEHEQDSKFEKSLLSNKGVHKRKAAAADQDGEENIERRGAGWGSKFKHYPGNNADAGDNEDLDALLNAVSKHKTVPKAEGNGEGSQEAVKQEADDTNPVPSIQTLPDINEPLQAIKKEQNETEPAVVFKKRKVKR